MFLKNIIAYNSANIAGRVIMLAQVFILRRMLPPTLMGLWNLVDVIRGFVETFDLGIMPAAARKLPLLRGEGDKDGEEVVRSTAFWGKVGQGVFVVVAVAVYTLFYWSDYNTDTIIAICAATVMVMLAYLFYAFEILHQCAQLYVPLSRAIVRYTFLYAFLTILGTYLWGVYGLIGGAIVAYVFQVLILWLSAEKAGIGVKWRWSTQRLKELLSFGVPLRVVDYPQNILYMADVIVITKYMGLEPLAIYSTAKLFLSQATQLPAWTTNVIIMRIFNLAGGGKDRGEIGKELMRVLTVSYLVFMPIMICSVIYILALVIAVLIPEYDGSIEVMTLLIFAVYFVPQTSIVRNFWILDKKMAAIGISNLIGLAAAAVALYFSVGAMGMTLEAVAIAYVIGFAVYYVVVMLFAGTGVLGLKGSLYIMAMCFVSAAATFAVVNYIPVRVGGDGFLDMLGASVVNYMTALLLLLPVIAYGILRSGLVGYLLHGRARQAS